MLKRIFFVIAASLLMLGAVGCACDGGVVSPSPTASMRPIETPAAATPGMDLSASPDMSTSPDAGGDTGGNTGGGAGGNTGGNTGGGTGGNTGATIPNFSAGTEVKPEDIPEIKTAIDTKYSGATIKTIKHALQEGKQVYEVEIEQNGTTQKIYVQPDGTILPEGNAAS